MNVRIKHVRPLTCPHCNSELISGLSHRYLMRCSNWKECARYVLA